MKKLTNLVALAAALVTVAFTSCSNISTGNATVSSSDLKGGKNITLIASSEDNIIDFSDITANPNARTIMPDAVVASTLKFYLLYKNNTAGATEYTLSSALTLTPDKTIAADGYSTGTITQVFDLADYSFILYAVNDADLAYSKKSPTLAAGNIAQYAQYVGYANADLRYYDTIRFKLQVNNYAAGKGVVDLKISNANDWQVPENYRVTAALRKIDNEEKIVFPADKAATIYGEKLGAAGSLKDVAFGSDTSEVATGEYNLVIAYNKYADTDDTKTPVATYYYTEKVVILLNQTTKQDVEVPEILEQPPAAPSNLVVAYQIPDNLDTPYYPVRFAWFDNADNESEYILELKQVDTADTYPVQPATDSTFDGLTATATITLDKLGYQASDLNPGLNDQTTAGNGSLNKNSKFVTVLLSMEHRYVARICASNDSGKSAYAYPTYALEAGTDPTKVTLSAPWTSFADDVKTINLFKITYDLNGGKFVNADADGTGLATAAVLTHYASQRTNTTGADPAASDTDIAIINPDGHTLNEYYTDVKGVTPLTTGVALTLENQGLYWSKWVKDNESSGTDYTQTVEWAENGGTFIKNIKYFPHGFDNSTVTGSLGSQPTKASFGTGEYDTDKKYYVRKATVAPYTDFKNLYLVAKYDTSKVLYIETDNLQSFEMTDEMIATLFYKGSDTALTGSDVCINSANDVQADTVTDLSKVNNKLLSVSQSKVEKIKFTLTGSFVTTSFNGTDIVKATDKNYDKGHLVITRVRDNVKLVDSDWVSAANNYWNVTIKTWTPGKYTLLFTGNISEQPKTTYSYSCALEITQ